MAKNKQRFGPTLHHSSAAAHANGATGKPSIRVQRPAVGHRHQWTGVQDHYFRH
jgi:hypothetical protein